MEEQYFLNRQDRYWLINDAPALCDYLEDLIVSMLGASDKVNLRDRTKNPFGNPEKVKWKQRVEGYQRQERVLNYLASSMLETKSSAGELGVVETRKYEVKQLTDPAQSASNSRELQTLQAAHSQIESSDNL